MPYGTREQQEYNPWLDRAGGAAAGVAGTLAVQEVRKAKSRATWALGLSIGIIGLELYNSGNLNTAMTNAQNIAAATAALTFDAAVTGIQVAALRSQVIALANNQANLAYYANIFNWFQSQPTQQAAPVQITAITTTTVTQSNNNNLAVLLLLGVGIAAIAWSS